MVYEEQPTDFIPDMEVVGCLVEYKGKILLLKRLNNKWEANKHGVVGGKVDKSDANIVKAMSRELREETGIQIDEKNLNFYKTFYVSHLGFKFLYHYFNLKLDKLPNVIISEGEHQSFSWATPIEALKMNLVLDEDYCMKNYYGIK